MYLGKILENRVRNCQSKRWQERDENKVLGRASHKDVLGYCTRKELLKNLSKPAKTQQKIIGAREVSQLVQCTRKHLHFGQFSFLRFTAAYTFDRCVSVCLAG